MNYYLGLDVGGTNLAAGIVTDTGELIFRHIGKTCADRSIEEITEDFVRVSSECISKSGIPIREIRSWGIGMPSCINPKTSLLVHANCFGWRNVPVFDYLAGKLPMPVFIENDANCAALGETRAGAAKGHRNVLMLTLGTGLGSGVIIGGQIYSGADGMGAELGHTKLVHEGRLCTCGKKGCVESYCSATALIAQSRLVLQNHPESLLMKLCGGNPAFIDGEMIFNAYRLGDRTSKEIVNQYISYLAGAISSFVTIFRPEVIILGGGISGAGELLLQPLRKKVREVTFAAEEIGIPDIIAAELGNDAGIIGAALLGM